MANEEHLELLLQGADKWNAWRHSNNAVEPDLTEANLINRDLSRADLDRTDLSGADLSKAQLSHASLLGARLESATLILADLLGATLNQANLSGASFFGAFLFATRLNASNLRGANLLGASLMGADLSFSDLRGAHLMGANLHEANLKGANLTGADLTSSSLVRTNVEGAIFDNCAIHGISTWDLEGRPGRQQNLMITPKGEAAVLVNDLEIGQLVSLIAYGKAMSDLVNVIRLNTATVIGRFRAGRKELLESCQNGLEAAGLVPITLEWASSAVQNPLQTATALSNVSRLLVVDLTDLRGAAGPLQQLLDQCESVPILAVAGKDESIGAFEASRKRFLTNSPLRYEGPADLQNQLDRAISTFLVERASRDHLK